MYTESARVCFRFYFHCSVILLSLLGPPTHTHSGTEQQGGP